MIKRGLGVSLLALTLFLVGSCTGSGSGSGGIGGTGIAMGTITGFGSVIVNGIEFETSGAQITVDGVPDLSENDLRVGQVVRIQGNINADSTGSADSIVANDILEGPITAKPNANTLIVLGQIVQVDAFTRFDDNVPTQSISGLSIGDVIEIHGFIQSAGVISATLIERQLGTVDLQVIGFVSNTNLAAQTFSIGSLIVDFSQAVIDDLPGNQPADGQMVEVQGSGFSGGVLIASRVEPGGLGVVDADDVEFEGFITAVASTVQFTVTNQPVQINAATVFDGGDPTDLLLGAKVEVEGELVSGLLLATKVSFRTNVRIEADAQSADPVAGILKLQNLSAITVSVDNLTELKDDTGAGADTDPSTFLASIGQGDRIELRGRRLQNGNVITTRLERDDPDLGKPLEIRAPVDLVDAANLSLVTLGVTILTDGNTDFDGDTGTFFTQTQPGVVIKVEGRSVGDNLILAENLESDD